jgi:3-oxoacyl-[acyl-carrier-protein] synthase II
VKRSVVVSGIGLVTPLSPFGTVGEFWTSLCSGKDAVRRMAAPMLDTGREWLAARIDVGPDVQPEDKFLHIADSALIMAVADAGLDDRKAGISVGTLLGNMLLKQKRLMNGGGHPDGMKGPESLSYPAAYLAKKHELGGLGLTISTACASGADAIGAAAREIMSGRADVMIAGGVDVLSDFALTGFHVLQALTETKVRPFDKNRSGLALGEGAAFVVLEPEKLAVRRGARIYGRILGYASRFDAHHLTAPHREGRGLAAAAGEALLQSGLAPAEIGYINAHGTGTIYNDLMETVVIRNVFGKAAYNIPVSSTKSMLGHSFGAAGAIEAICCLLSIGHNTVPPTINFEERDPACDLDYVPNLAREHTVNAAMSLSAGFGGQNSAIIVGAL